MKIENANRSFAEVVPRPFTFGNSEYIVCCYYPAISDYQEHVFAERFEADREAGEHVKAGANVQIIEHRMRETITDVVWYPAKKDK